MDLRAACGTLVIRHVGRPQGSVFGQTGAKGENGRRFELLDLLMLAHVGGSRFAPMWTVLPSVLAQAIWVEVDLQHVRSAVIT